MAAEGHRPRARRHEPRAALDRRRRRVPARDAELRGRCELQGPAGGARGALEPRGEGTIALLDASAFDAPSTSAEVLEGWGERFALVVATEDEEVVVKSFRNIPKVLVTVPAELEVVPSCGPARCSSPRRAPARPRACGCRRGGGGSVSNGSPSAHERHSMSLHRTMSSSRPSSSEKSYSLITDRKYTFRVHADAHKTHVRQAVEELFEVEVASVNIVKVQSKPKRRGLIKGSPAWLEEGDRPVEGRPRDRDLRRSLRLMALKKYKPTSPGRRFMATSGFEEITKSEPTKSPSSRRRRRAGATTAAGSRRATRAGGTSAASARSTSSG